MGQNTIKGADDHFLRICLPVGKNGTSGVRQEVGLAYEHGGFVQFVDYMGMVRVTRTNAYVRNYLTSLGYSIETGGPVLTIDHIYVDKLMWNKMEKLYADGLSRGQIINALFEDLELLAAISLALDPVFSSDKISSHHPNPWHYLLNLTAYSEYLDPQRYYNGKFKEIVVPNVDHFLDLKNESLGTGSGGRGSR